MHEVNSKTAAALVKGRYPLREQASQLRRDHESAERVHEMKLSRVASSGPIEAGRNLGVVALVACLLLPCLLLSVLKSNFHGFSFGNLQVPIGAAVQLQHIQDDTDSSSLVAELRIGKDDLKEELVDKQSSSSFIPMIQATTLSTGQEAKETLTDFQVTRLPGSYEQMQHDNVTTSDIQVEPLPQVAEEKQSENMTNTGVSSPTSDKQTQIGEWNNNTAITGEKQKNISSNFEGKFRGNVTNSGNLVLQSNMRCDISHDRYDTCFMNGDVRVIGPSSTLILASSSQLNDTILKTRPYARKWESAVMETISELTLRSSSKHEETPLCTVNHNVPAIIFSTGGFVGNFFHDFTDVLVPLFITSRQYQGHVQFLVTNYKAQWVTKYMAILSQLTRYEIINLDAQDGHVHCFTQAQIGLMNHKVMGVDPMNTPNGYTMDNFRDMLRTSFSLKRKSIREVTKKPRLLILQRKGSRSLVNKREVVGLGRHLGFKVVVAGPEEMKNLSRFAQSVNSADVMMGVHGAGLANMVFLPTGASLIQIVPWGGLKWACWHDFGEPAPEMGVRYLEYEIKEEESTLIQHYPRNHPVFTDPESVQKQGWNVLWSVFLHKQNVKLDVHRFKNTLLEALKVQH